MIPQYASTVRTFVIVAILLAANPGFASTTVAQEDTPCQRRVDGIRAQTLRFAEGIEQLHGRELAGILSSYERRRDVPSEYRATAEASVARIIERNNVDELRAEMVEEPIEEYRFTFSRSSNPSACPPARALRDFFRAYLNHFELGLESIRDEVSSRLMIDRLQSDEGLLIIAYDSDWGANTVSINRLGAIGGISFTAPMDGQLFRILPVKAGEYRWEEISKDVFGGRRVIGLDRIDLRFTVQAGQINYVGSFLVNEYPRYTNASVHQRTSMVMAQAFELYPEIMARYDIVNAANSNDPFLPFLLAERQRAASATDDAQ